MKKISKAVLLIFVMATGLYGVENKYKVLGTAVHCFDETDISNAQKGLDPQKAAAAVAALWQPFEAILYNSANTFANAGQYRINGGNIAVIHFMREYKVLSLNPGSAAYTPRVCRVYNVLENVN